MTIWQSILRTLLTWVGYQAASNAIKRAAQALAEWQKKLIKRDG